MRLRPKGSQTHLVAPIVFGLLFVGSLFFISQASGAEAIRLAGVPAELTISEVSARTLRIEVAPLA